MEKYDFCGWATRNDLKCSDGRIIRKDAFKHNDGQTVPLVWNHQHNDSMNVLGHALLKNMEEGVYAYGKFNDTEQGQNAKKLVEHGDVSALSIYANQLQQRGSDVLHGAIREVSLVLAGANPGAFIDSIIRHGEASEEEAIIYTGEDLELSHAEEKPEEKKEEDKKDESDDKTVGEILKTLNQEQLDAVAFLIAQLSVDEVKHSDEPGESEEVIEHSEESEENSEEEAKHSELENTEGGNTTMKINVFDQETQQEGAVLQHSEETMMSVIADAKRYGSLKESALAHGIEHIDYLFPEAKNLDTPPQFIQREMGWVQKVMRGVHHTPFSRIKSTYADITGDEARARGYIKGNLKKEEVFTLLKRTTAPTTIYKKQKLDRDDVIDITDFDVVGWLKAEMRMMLDEEIARAILVGDGRLGSSDDKIKEDCIRPIWTDSELYTIKAAVEVAPTATADERAKAFIRAAIKNRKNYKGSGSPVLYTTEDVITDCLLMEDKMGRVIYDSVAKLATVLRVSEIVTVPVMEGLTRTDNDGNTRSLMAIMVNLNDYNVGADKGGAVNMFDDFDIDYNAQKYLIETRCSGALIKPFSAMALELVEKSVSAE